MKKICKILAFTLILIFCFTAPISALEMSSPYGIVVDAKDGGPLYEKNADTPRPIASTTKLMTLLLIFDDLKAGKTTLDSIVPISQETSAASSRDDWSNVPLSTENQYTVKQIIECITVKSACGASIAIAEYLDGSEDNFVDRMNAKARQLGLSAYFVDATGLSDDGYSTARSLAELSTHLLNIHPEITQYTSLTSTRIDGVLYKATNELLPGGTYEYLGADGLKTGSTTPAGMCLVGTATRNGTRIVTVILGASSSKSRYTDTIKMLDHGFATAPLYPLIFKDVKNSAWYFDYVKSCYESGLVSGTETYTFAPETQVTRAMFVTVLGRMWEKTNDTIPQKESSDFADVKMKQYYGRYVEWAAENGIVAGYSETTFAPNDNISREQMMRILYQYHLFLTKDDNSAPPQLDPQVLAPFADKDKISSWAKDGAIWCVTNNVINGMNATTIAPKGPATRAQMTTVFVELAA